MAAAKAAGEAAMLPGMIEVEAGIIASGVVADPGAVVVDMRGFGMAWLVVKTGRRVGDRSMTSGWAMLGNVSAADGVAACFVASVLRQGWERNQGYSN